jgi:hypothetical protein
LLFGSGFDPTCFRHFSTTYRPAKSLADQLGFGRAICTTLEWASCISFVTTSHIHGGADVPVTHQFLLDGNRGSRRIETTSAMI